MRKPLAEKVFAYYRGDEFVAMGTAKELAEMPGVKMEAVSKWASPSNVKAVGGSPRGPVCVRVDEDD